MLCLCGGDGREENDVDDQRDRIASELHDRIMIGQFEICGQPIRSPDTIKIICHNALIHNSECIFTKDSDDDGQ